MGIIVFVVLAGVWAAFLLPSFFDSRRSAPIATTRNFAKSTALLASVATLSAQREAMARQRALARRRRILVALACLAVGTLGVAIWYGSVPWLAATLVVDAVLAAYVALLLQLKQQRPPAPVVPLPLREEEPLMAASSVRIVAG